MPRLVSDPVNCSSAHHDTQEVVQELGDDIQQRLKVASELAR